MNFTFESHYCCECMAFFLRLFQWLFYFPENNIYSIGVYPLMEKI
jgi:hypothetical protein